MKNKKKTPLKLLSSLLAVLLLLTAVPFSAFAAPASDIPAEMLDNAYLDALAYTGYNVQAQKNDGTIFKKYSSGVSASVRSNISYGTGPSGLETVSKSGTATGLAPNISKFEQSGLCCASYVSYVYYNYLPNIAGIDTSIPACPSNPRSAVAYNTAANSWVSSGTARRITFSQNSNGSNFVPNESIPIGSLIIFKEISTGDIAHVAIYAGYYGGQYFVTHVGNDNGPEFCTIVGMSKGGTPEAVAQIVTPEFIEDNGTIEVSKKDPNGKNLAGAYFVATNTKDSAKQYLIGPTDANGYAVTKERLPYGTYSVKETVFPENYTSYGQTEWSVTLNSANQTVKINAVNAQKTGNVKVIKNSEDNLSADITFALKGTSALGESISLTAKTDSTGTALFKDVPIGNGYVISEQNTATKYVIPKDETVTVKFGETSTVTVKNILKKFCVEVVKTDAETDTAQGDATLTNAAYGLYKGDTLKATYYTDKDGKFTTDYFPCGTDWTIKEISPSNGYLLDATVYSIPAGADKFTVEKNSLSLSVKETVQKGTVSLIKHSDDGTTQIETPEENAEFEVYLKSSGSFGKAKDSERDIIITDTYGFAQTKELPFGIYTVHQTKGLEGREFMADFDVSVSKNNEDYRYLINNAVFAANIVLQKTDAETGKSVPASGVGFKVKSKATGDFITQHINYPTPTDISIFYTAEDGTLMLPSSLEYGDYELYEVKSCYGYTLNESPVPFSVDGSQTTVTVSMPNMAQKGKLVIEKKGEVFASVTENDGIYTPVYAECGLENAEFQIVADENIITPDGTVRAEKGTVVDTVTTGKDGKAESKELYLGKYRIIETQAPFGMVLNNEPYYTELVYSDENTKVVINTVSVTDERQKAVIGIKKEMESDLLFGIGQNNEVMNVQFGIFAAEDMVAADGSIIPKDGLLEITSVGADKIAVFAADLPVSAKVYVKEIDTDEHYTVSNAVYPVSFDYTDPTVSFVNFFANDGEAVVNEIIYGRIDGNKTDENGKALAGAVFGLFSADAEDFSKETAIALATSDENGKFVFENVPYGKWLIKELSGIDGYVMNEELTEVSVDAPEQTVMITVINKKILGTVTAIKVNGNNHKEYLSGAVFEVYRDVNNNGVFDIDTDTLFGTMKETDIGFYELSELPNGGYFLHEAKSPDGFVKDDRYFFFTISESGQTVNIENEKGVGFINNTVPGEYHSPQTGDTSRIGLWLVLMFTSLGAMTVLLIGRKKKNKA